MTPLLACKPAEAIAAPSPEPGAAAREGRHPCVQLIDAFELESGEVLRDVRQMYYLDGTLNTQRDNLVVVVHALTGSADAVGDWWSDVAGPGRAIDTDRYAVLCTNLLGSCYGTTGPGDSSNRPFPRITTRDMARLVERLLESLHVRSVALAIGGSLGGMVALELAATFPALARNIVALAAPGEHPAAALAWSHLQRRAIALGGSGDEGLELARMIAMMTYRTSAELEERFGRGRDAAGEFAVARYLSHHGEKLRARFDVQSYLTLIDAMDTHDVGRGRGGMAAALRAVTGRVVGVGIPGDLLYHPRDVRRWTHAAGAEYREIHAVTGHDAFLTETTQVASLVRDVLAEPPLTATAARRAATGVAIRSAWPPAPADVIVLGYGRIGREVAAQLSDVVDPTRARVVAVVDRSGYVLDAGGLSPARLAALSRAKTSGTGLAQLPEGTAASATEAIAALDRRVLNHPILVDATASETTFELETALAAGMDIVLANKRPLTQPFSKSGGLAGSAAKRGLRILYEATVGAGLPIIDTIGKLQESGDTVLRIDGCLSGTLGYVFGELGRGTPFSSALLAAIALGYTEPDPRDDLSGMDVARKALILARSLGFSGDLDEVEVESLVPGRLRDVAVDEFLTRLPELDAPWRARVEAASAAGRVLRYHAAASASRVAVGFTPVPVSSSSGALSGTDNLFSITTTRYGAHPIVISGPGAGIAVTAGGILNDVLKLARSNNVQEGVT